MPSPTDSLNTPPHGVDLDVRGAVPPGLSGRLIGTDRDGVLHSVQFHEGRVSYLRRRFRTARVAHNLVAFGGSILLFGEGAPAYELSTHVDTLRRVDLAGRGRALGAYPKHDPATGELHLIARDPNGAHAHIVVSAGSLTRQSRPFDDAPNRITDLAVTGDRVVFVADGFVGVASRDREPRTTWIATGLAAPHAIHAHDVADTVVLLALTPMLERWSLHPPTGNIQRETLDPTPRRFAHRGNQGSAIAGAPRSLWTTGNGTIGYHDFVTSRNVHHRLGSDVPGDLVFVADASRATENDGGWLVGFVHDLSGAATELDVIDAADIFSPALAAVRMPRRFPDGFGCTWIPSTEQRPPQQSPSPQSPSPEEN